MTDAAIAADVHETLDVHGHFTAKVTLPAEASGMKDYVKSVNLWASKPYDKIDWNTYDLQIGEVNVSGEYVPETLDASEGINDLLEGVRT